LNEVKNCKSTLILEKTGKDSRLLK